MAILGLSLLIVSISFLCYRHPPTWNLLAWFHRAQPTIDNGSRGNDADSTNTIPLLVVEEKKDQGKQIEYREDSRLQDEKVKTTESAVNLKDDRKERDRMAMPPPQLPTFKAPLGTGDTTPKAGATKVDTAIPSLTLEDTAPPSFPALNSAQRASGGRMGPPRLPPLRGPASGPLPQRGNLGASLGPPSRGPLPNRGPPTSSSLAPPPTHSAVPTKPSRKVLLTPGHSPLDWARLSSSPTANLRGIDPSLPYLRVPPSLLKTMNGRKGKDAWTVLGGRVYNITPYAPYHPGGEPELLRAAGRDGTKLFGEVHPWVNWEGMLEACLVGIPVEEGDGDGQAKSQDSWLEQMD